MAFELDSGMAFTALAWALLLFGRWRVSSHRIARLIIAVVWICWVVAVWKAVAWYNFSVGMRAAFGGYPDDGSRALFVWVRGTYAAVGIPLSLWLSVDLARRTRHPTSAREF